jgi:DNA-binding XRE family transcriptional regulator
VVYAPLLPSDGKGRKGGFATSNFKRHSLFQVPADWRLKMDMSQKSLAEKLGVSLRTLKNWECNRGTPNRLYRAQIKALFE